MHHRQQYAHVKFAKNVEGGRSC